MRTNTPPLSFFFAGTLCLLLGACGVGSGGDEPPTDPSVPTADQRKAAATDTAQSTTNACAPIRPFYWEIGDGAGALASGSVNATGNPTTYSADSNMGIASASKWLYSSYVAELRNGAMTADDIKFLSFRSGYTNFSLCLPGQTVGACAAFQQNGVKTDSTEGKFFYDGGHMQNHATSLKQGDTLLLAGLDNAGLASEVRARLGADIQLSYSQPQLAGGVRTTPRHYAIFLRKLLNNQLKMAALLGSSAVCTNPTTCSDALKTPSPENENWHYSLGHWVEDDPAVGDGSFSSAGAFGFYPWIDANREHYGIVARQDMTSENQRGFASVGCGRLIRRAWLSGVAQ